MTWKKMKFQVCELRSLFVFTFYQGHILCRRSAVKCNTIWPWDLTAVNTQHWATQSVEHPRVSTFKSQNLCGLIRVAWRSKLTRGRTKIATDTRHCYWGSQRNSSSSSGFCTFFGCCETVFNITFCFTQKRNAKNSKSIHFLLLKVDFF